LKTATLNAAKALGKTDQIGVIKANANADIAVFDGDLEMNFKTVLFKVKLVIKDGSIVYSK
jgi:imidazolonepropionase-like amidohydrolase